MTSGTLYLSNVHMLITQEQMYYGLQKNVGSLIFFINYSDLRDIIAASTSEVICLVGSPMPHDYLRRGPWRLSTRTDLSRIQLG